MGVEEDVFEEFFKRLNEDEEVPENVIFELKRLLKGGDIFDKESILKAIIVGGQFNAD